MVDLLQQLFKFLCCVKTGNSQKEIATNLLRMANVQGAKFIMTKPDCTRLNLDEIFDTNKVELVIQGDKFESKRKIVDIEGLRKIRDAAECAKIQYYFKHENLLFGN